MHFLIIIIATERNMPLNKAKLLSVVPQISIYQKVGVLSKASFRKTSSTNIEKTGKSHKKCERTLTQWLQTGDPPKDFVDPFKNLNIIYLFYVLSIKI